MDQDDDDPLIPFHEDETEGTADESVDESLDEPADSDAADLSELRDVLAGRAAPRHERADDPEHTEDKPAVPADTRRPRPVRTLLIATLVMVIIVGAAAGGVWWWWGQRHSAPTDWAGTGAQTTIVRVQNGDGLHAVGETLESDGVVADGQTFVGVALDDGRLSALAPGYYQVHLHSSAQSVIDELADSANRVGQLRIIPGTTLADLTTVATDGTKSVKPGILSLIADACVPTNGDDACFTVDDLWRVAQQAPLNELGVIGWATDDVAAAPNAKRRLEGVILPGDYTIAPGSTAKEALAAVVSASAARWNSTDVVAAAQDQHRTPYQLATIASLIQAEAIGADMPKVARVIDNRLAIGMKLQFDSTVNYGLARARIATSEAERLDESNLYSTYAHAGLPPTPIGSPGPNALEAAENPADGDWLYFVAVDTDGHTCFSETIEEHEACVDKARANGVFG